MFSIRTAVVCGFALLLSGAVAPAQGPGGELPEPNIDEVVAHLGLVQTQVECLDANKDDFLDAVSPCQQQMRDLKRQLRQASRNGEDTTGLQSQIEAVRAAIQSTWNSFSASAKQCLEADQMPALNELVGAETLMNEVRQGMGLLLIQPTEAKPAGVAIGHSNGKRGRP